MNEVRHRHRVKEKTVRAYHAIRRGGLIVFLASSAFLFIGGFLMLALDTNHDKWSRPPRQGMVVSK